VNEIHRFTYFARPHSMEVDDLQKAEVESSKRKMFMVVCRHSDICSKSDSLSNVPAAAS